MNINVTIGFNKLNLYDNLFGLFLFYRKKTRNFIFLKFLFYISLNIQQLLFVLLTIYTLIEFGENTPIIIF